MEDIKKKRLFLPLLLKLIYKELYFKCKVPFIVF